DRPRRGYTGTGSLWIDGVELVRPRKMTEALTVEVKDKRLGNVYEPGETVELRASAPGEGVRWRVEDYQGGEIARGDASPVRFGLPEAGWYACTLERLADGRVAEARVFRCAALPPADPRERNAFVGVCSHFRGSAYPLETMDLMVRYGITQIRDEISWSAVEKAQGELVLPDYGCAFTDYAARLGVEPLLIFDYANRFYDEGGFPISEPAVAGYARYAATLAGWMAGKVDAFEVWNEYSIGCGMRGKTGEQTPETYARMLVETYRRVKAVRPDATVVGIGGEHSQHHFDNIERMLEAGAADAMDALSVHSYRYPRTPEATDLVGEIRAVAELARRHDARDRIWVTEIGWPTHVGVRGVDERTQARLIVRTLALLQATGVVQKVHWYDFKNDGLNREYNEHNFGVVWHQAFNYAPKPAAVALAVFARMTAGGEAPRLWRDGDPRVVLYRLPDGRDLAIAWTTEGVRSLSLTGKGLEGYDLQGNPLPQPLRPTATSDPTYFIGRGLQPSLAPE
ncbi:MAG: glycosyl hydrolase, partial [Planctomycetota bacterium]